MAKKERAKTAISSSLLSTIKTVCDSVIVLALPCKLPIASWLKKNDLSLDSAMASEPFLDQSLLLHAKTTAACHDDVVMKYDIE